MPETRDLPSSLLNRRILFFGGKGGVGKTTTAAAFAVLSARASHRTLLVSTDPAPSTSDILETQLSAEPIEVRPNLWAMEIDPREAADKYISEVKQRIADVTPPRLAAEVERQIDIARVSPGAEEAALFDRVTRLFQQESVGFDRILIDTAPTGHTLRLLTLPESMTTWMTAMVKQRRRVNALGKMWRNVAGAAAGDDRPVDDPVLEALIERKTRFQRARKILTDSRQTAFVFVVIPERLPILETERAVDTLEKHRIPIGGVLVNRTIPATAQGDFIARRREREREYLSQIQERFGHLPIYHIQLLDHDIRGIHDLERIIGQLSAEGGHP